MKRRLKLTPFAKIVFVLIIIAGARYVYIHQKEISEGRFFNFKDTLNLNFQDSESEIKSKSDTIILRISENDSLIRLNINGTITNVLKDSSGLKADTILLKISDKKNIPLKVIVE